MRIRVVKKLHNEWMFLERVLNDTALHTAATAVDEPHFVQTG
jgi:hypothetical protein